MDSLRCELLRCQHCLLDHDTCCDDGTVSAVTDDLTPTDVKYIVRCVIVGRTNAADPQVDGTVIGNRCVQHGRRLHCVRGAEHCHVWECTHHGDILDRLMRCSVIADAHPCMCPDELDVQFWIGDAVADLVKCPACEKD